MAQYLNSAYNRALQMGIFIKALQKQSQPNKTPEFFGSNSLTKLREYYSIFKNISQTYSIDTEQFEQLFGNKHEEIFELLDTDRNLLIDGLELFAGLILLSYNIHFQDKLFDFNDLKSLSRTDLEFLFLSSCNSVVKVFALKPAQDDKFIEEFVREEFPSDERVNISEMHKWARKSQTVSTFFKLIVQIQHIQPVCYQMQKMHLRLPPADELYGFVDFRQQQQQQRFMLQTQKLFKNSQEVQKQLVHGLDVAPQIKWVYGIRYRDVKQFIEYVRSPFQQLILYFVGKVAVVYNVHSQQQKHYTGHTQQIISITVQDNLCATGDFGLTPEIRVWDLKTLETIQILRGTHVRGVHLLKFYGSLLISCGCQEESPIIIFDIETGEAIFSTYCCSPAVQISLLCSFTNRSTRQFIIASLYSVYHFDCLQSQDSAQVVNFKMSRMGGERYESNSPITACCFFIINQQYRYLSQYDRHSDKQVVTGHENGAVYVWNLTRGQRQYSFSQQMNPVVRLLATHNHLLVVTNSSFLAYYNINLQDRQRIRSIDVTQVDQQLRSYDIAECLICNKQELLIVTKRADIFFLVESEHVQLPTLTHFTHRKYQTRLVDRILQVQGRIIQHKLVTQEKERILYVAIQHMIVAVDLDSHKFIKQWNIGEKILTFDAVYTKGTGVFVVAATEANRLYSFANTTQNISRQNLQTNAISVLIHHDNNPTSIIVLVSTKDTIIKYGVARNNFVNANPYAFAAVAATLSPFEGNKIMMSAQNNSLKILLIKQMHAQNSNDVDYKTASPILKLHFHIPLGNDILRLPVLVGLQSKVLVATRKDGRIHLWTSFEDLYNRTSLTLSAHISSISDIVITEDQRQLISSGSTDGMLIQWHIRSFLSPGSSITASKLHDDRIQYVADELASRRIDYCKFQNNLLGQSYDQHLQIKGINSQTIRRLFKSNFNDWKQQNAMRRSEQSPINLKLDFALGIETFHKNSTVIALSNPKRFLYFVSKILVIYNPALNTQTFYRGHKYKVTCLVLLDKNERVASGQAAYRPTIHLWNTNTLQTQRIIQTGHRWGIVELTAQGHILLSWGLRYIREEAEQGKQDSSFEHNIYSYQVTNYQTGYIVAQRDDKDLVHSMAINPKHNNRFASCSDGRVVFWQVVSNSIIRRKVCCLINDTPTCCAYYFSGKGEADLLVGTRAGSLGMVSRNEHWTTFFKDDKQGRQINCLLVVPHEQELLIILASEGNYLRILNHKFQQRFYEDMSKLDLAEEGSKRVWEGKAEKLDRNCSVQSVSQIETKGQFRILLGTRNGQVLQLVQSKEYNRYSSKQINFKAVLFLRFNMAQTQTKGRNKVFVAHHPRYQILASIGMDQQLLFWDCQRRRLLHSAYLGLDRQKCYPTAIKFNHNGDYLMVGYSDGLLVFLDSRISKSMQGKADEKYSPPSLTMLKKDKAQEGHVILNMELSQNGDFLAVSYHKLVADRSHACIQLFASRLKDKTKNYARFQNEKIFEHFSTVPCPHTEKAYRGEDGVMHGFAAYSMAFAECENKHYFLIYFQLLDQNQNRLAISSEGDEERNYKVWDVSSSTVIANSALIESIKWKKIYMHNAIEAHYTLHQPYLTPLQPTDTPPSNNNLLLPQFTNMVLLEQHLVTVSLNGDLHVIKLSALQGQDTGLVGKTMPGHSCKINQIQTNHDRTVLYTTGQSDECIMKWVVQESASLIDSQGFQQDDKDLFGEALDHEDMKLQLQLWISKSKIGNNIIRNNKFIDPLKVVDILGRRAEQIRNNLKYDHFGRTIFSSGHAVVIVDRNKPNKEFIYVKDDPNHIIQEITAIQVSHDGQFIFTSHAGTRATVMQWQLSSKILQKRLQFEQITYILMIAVSQDMSRLILYGLTAQASGQVLFANLQNSELLSVCSYSHKKPWNIKAIAFVPGSHDCFVSCGIQHTKYWQFMSGQLVYSNLPGADSSRINTCLAFLGEQLVTGNDHGELVVWISEPIRRKEHQNMITCLAVSPHANEWLITTGSLNSEDCDFHVLLWSYLNAELSVLHKVNLAVQTPAACFLSGRFKPTHRPRDLEIQSVFMNAGNILIGSSRGDVYQYNYDWAVKKTKPAQNLLKQIFVYEDGQHTKAMFFTASEDQLIQISEKGLLRVWDMPHTHLRWSYDFELEVVNMIYSQKCQLIIIAFKGELRFFRWSMQSMVQIQQNYRQFLYITHLVLSHNQKFVALGIQRNSDKLNLIQLYEISAKQFIFKLRLNLDSPIIFLDFNRLTPDKAFMLVSTSQRIELFDLVRGVTASEELVKRIDWMGEGLLLSEKTEIIRAYHEQQMQFSSIKTILQLEGFLILDSSGGVHWYKDNRLWAICSLNISSIDCYSLSPSRKWLALASKIDRNVVILELSLVSN